LKPGQRGCESAGHKKLIDYLNLIQDWFPDERANERAVFGGLSHDPGGGWAEVRAGMLLGNMFPDATG
jgi:hypothetical protein